MSENNIYKKLIKVQNELKAPKNQYNGFGKYKYRNCEDILEAVKPLLLDNGLTMIISDEVVNVEERFYIKATVTLLCIDTEKSIQVSALAREELNKKGMDGSQVTGSSSSYARKYALNGLFCIDDTKDADTEEQQQKTTNNKTVKRTNQSSTLSDKQIKRLEVLGKKAGFSLEEVKNQVYTKYEIKVLNQLSKQQYDNICTAYENIINK